MSFQDVVETKASRSTCEIGQKGDIAAPPQVKGNQQSDQGHRSSVLEADHYSPLLGKQWAGTSAPCETDEECDARKDVIVKQRRPKGTAPSSSIFEGHKKEKMH